MINQNIIMETKHIISDDPVEGWLDDESPTKERIGHQNGNTPRNNKEQNEGFRKALKDLGIDMGSDKRDQAKREIEHQWLENKELEEELRGLLGLDE